MRRFRKSFPASLALAFGALIVAWASLGPGMARAADPDELAELLKSSGSTGTDAAKVEALLDVLREAERRHAQGRPAAGPVDAKLPADASGTASPARAADAAAEPEASGSDAAQAKADGEAEADAEPEKPKPVVRAGCMYSGTKLIWEKVPGSCER
jgi:hypothetical protein